MPNLRHDDMLALLRERGKASVEELASYFDVTVQTIRRDLTELELGGKIARVHGGATIRSGVANIEYDERCRLNADAKDAIGALTARHVSDDISLFMNIGTTTEAVARHLLTHNNLTVLTNNINIATIMAANASCNIEVSGGTLRRTDGGLVGDVAIQMIERFKVDIAIIGTSALDTDGDLLDYDSREVGISRAIIRNARRVFLVADKSKRDRTAPVRIGSLADIDAMFTDAALKPDLVEKCKQWNTAIHIT